MDAKYEEIKGTVNLKGFRPGKVPKAFIGIGWTAILLVALLHADKYEKK
jgi:hypothetical protein